MDFVIDGITCFFSVFQVLLCAVEDHDKNCGGVSREKYKLICSSRDAVVEYVLLDEEIQSLNFDILEHCIKMSVISELSDIWEISVQYLGDSGTSKE